MASDRDGSRAQGDHPCFQGGGQVQNTRSLICKIRTVCQGAGFLGGRHNALSLRAQPSTRKTPRKCRSHHRPPGGRTGIAIPRGRPHPSHGLLPPRHGVPRSGRKRQEERQAERSLHPCRTGQVIPTFLHIRNSSLKKITTLLPKTARLTCVRPDRRSDEEGEMERERSLERTLYTVTGFATW